MAAGPGRRGDLHVSGHTPSQAETVPWAHPGPDSRWCFGKRLRDQSTGVSPQRPRGPMAEPQPLPGPLPPFPKRPAHEEAPVSAGTHPKPPGQQLQGRFPEEGATPHEREPQRRGVTEQGAPGPPTPVPALRASRRLPRPTQGTGATSASPSVPRPGARIRVRLAGEGGERMPASE